jgi:hypothetical protein
MSYAYLMAFPSWLLVSVSGRRSQRPGPSPTLGSLGPSHHRRHKSRVSLRGPPCALGVSGISFGEVRDSNGSAFTYVCVPQYLKDILSVYTLVLSNPTSVATSPNNVQWQRIICHKLAISFNKHWASCSHMQWSSNLHQLFTNEKITRPVYTSKCLSNSAYLSMGGEGNLLLSSPNAWRQSSSHSRDSHFFNKMGEVLATLKKSQMKLW